MEEKREKKEKNVEGKNEIWKERRKNRKIWKKEKNEKERERRKRKI